MPNDELVHDRLTESIIGAFYEVYNKLGYGFFEGAYVKALMIELGYKGLEVQHEVGVDLYYKGHRLGRQRVDLIVDEKVIVEVKATEQLPRVAYRQCFSYLKTCGLEVGLILHFGPEPGIKRVRSSGLALGPNTEVVFPVEAGPRKWSPDDAQAIDDFLDGESDDDDHDADQSPRPS